MMLATITIDTEPDIVWGNLRSSGLENIRALARFHDFMTECGIPPTYTGACYVVGECSPVVVSCHPLPNNIDFAPLEQRLVFSPN